MDMDHLYQYQITEAYFDFWSFSVLCLGFGFHQVKALVVAGGISTGSNMTIRYSYRFIKLVVSEESDSLILGILFRYEDGKAR